MAKPLTHRAGSESPARLPVTSAEAQTRSDRLHGSGTEVRSSGEVFFTLWVRTSAYPHHLHVLWGCFVPVPLDSVIALPSAFPTAEQLFPPAAASCRHQGFLSELVHLLKQVLEPIMFSLEPFILVYQLCLHQSER